MDGLSDGQSDDRQMEGQTNRPLYCGLDIQIGGETVREKNIQLTKRQITNTEVNF
jgi:hypothetical protein